jgi:hypothetical protein
MEPAEKVAIIASLFAGFLVGIMFTLALNLNFREPMLIQRLINDKPRLACLVDDGRWDGALCWKSAR